MLNRLFTSQARKCRKTCPCRQKNKINYRDNRETETRHCFKVKGLLIFYYDLYWGYNGSILTTNGFIVGVLWCKFILIIKMRHIRNLIRTGLTKRFESRD